MRDSSARGSRYHKRSECRRHGAANAGSNEAVARPDPTGVPARADRARPSRSTQERRVGDRRRGALRADRHPCGDRSGERTGDESHRRERFRASRSVARRDSMKRDSLSYPFWSAEEIESGLKPALAHLQERRVLAYPTETVYGFGGAIDRDSVASLIRLKRRPPGKPFLLLIDGSDMLAKCDLQLPTYAAMLAARHWPGPLTLVLPGGHGRIPPQLRGPEGGIAVRWTSHASIQRLIRAHGDPRSEE